MFPSVKLNTNTTYNVVTLFSAVRILATLYSDLKSEGLFATKICIRETFMFNERTIYTSDMSQCLYNHE